MKTKYIFFITNHSSTGKLSEWDEGTEDEVPEDVFSKLLIERVFPPAMHTSDNAHLRI